MADKIDAGGEMWGITPQMKGYFDLFAHL